MIFELTRKKKNRKSVAKPFSSRLRDVFKSVFRTRTYRITRPIGASETANVWSPVDTFRVQKTGKENRRVPSLLDGRTNVWRPAKTNFTARTRTKTIGLFTRARVLTWATTSSSSISITGARFYELLNLEKVRASDDHRTRIRHSFDPVIFCSRRFVHRGVRSVIQTILLLFGNLDFGTAKHSSRRRYHSSVALISYHDVSILFPRLW